MLSLIYGGSSSGKSEYAEEYICSLSKGDIKYYIATMIRDGGDLRRIRTHVDRRKDMGFITVEQPYDLGLIVKKNACDLDGSYVLLECVSNLLANEMFERSVKDPAQKVIKDIECIASACRHLVVVSDDVFRDGIRYDESVREYMYDLATVNRALAKYADNFFEVVAGIPVRIK